MKMKMRLSGIPGVSHLSKYIACLYSRTGFYGQSERFQVSVISELIISMIDNHSIAARRLNVSCLAGGVFSHVASDGNNCAVLCSEDFLGVRVIVGITFAIALVAFAVLSDLQEIVSERFGQKPLVRIQVSMFGCNVPSPIKRQTARESLGAMQLD